MGYGFNQDTAQKIFDPGGFFKDTPTQPGVGGINANNNQLVRDPTTGLYYNPQTGTSYTDPDGMQPVTDPNVAQQVAADFSRAQSYLNAQQGVQRQQGVLADRLQQIVSGRAPSIAGMQTQQGMDAIAAQQQSQAAGVSGATSPLARLLAMRDTGAAQIGANNTGAIARVGEQHAAQNALQSLLSGESQTDASLGAGLSGQALSGQEAQQGLNATSDQNNAQKNQKLGASIIGLFA